MWVGKEFADMRQNERRIEFIRVGDAVRTVGQLKEDLIMRWVTLHNGEGSVFYHVCV